MPGKKRTWRDAAPSIVSSSSKSQRSDSEEGQSCPASRSKKGMPRKTTKAEKNTTNGETSGVTIHDRENCKSSEHSEAKTVFRCNFDAIRKPLQVSLLQNLQHMQRSRNFFHYAHGSSLGSLSAMNKQSVKIPIVRELEDLSLFRKASPFDRRITALEWHPNHPGMIAAGSKGGDIFLWNSLQQNINDNFIQGIGPGGSIQAIKFWPWNDSKVLTASIDGRVTLNDLEGRNSQVLSDTFQCIEGPGGNVSGMKFHPLDAKSLFASSLDGRLTLHDLSGRCNRILLNTFTWDSWYCCVDVSARRKAVVTGDNVGNTLLLSLDGKKVWSHRLHKQKVTHAEFSPREDWLFCTASTDQTVKVWDIRKVAGRDSALCVMKHDKGVNSAYFSATDGCRLLTTDQHSEIRVYTAPEWTLERTIAHPHRFYQHITPIKASWHPLQDLIVIGRYPHDQFPGYQADELRTIDILDADTGQMLSQLCDPSATGVVSLNKFNHRGDFLVSGMGVNMLLWGRSHKVEERQRSLLTQGLQTKSWFDPHGSQGSRGRGSGSNPSSRQSGKESAARGGKSNSKKLSDTKLEMKVQTKTKTKAPTKKSK